MSCPLLFAQTPEGLYFKPATSAEKTEEDAVIFLSSHDHSVRSVDVENFPIQSNNMRKISALLGFIRLKLNTYAIIADTVDEVGKFNDLHAIYKVLNYSVIASNLNARVDSDESEYLKLLNLQLKNADLFFSYTYDLTNSLQRNESIGNNTFYNWSKCDERFFWNYYITKDLRKLSETDSRVSKFVQPVIYGNANCTNTVFNSVPIQISLITRRSIFRAGTRYFRRGIDENGNVANFNETEQILIIRNDANEKNIFSFLQTRGSVPVYWAEINNLKYKPNLVLGEENSFAATKAHFDQQVSLYGDNYLVNLVNQKGHELPIKNSYETVVEELQNPKVHYTYFDFHHECRNMKWHRVKLLLDQLSKMGLSNADFFHKRVINNSQSEVLNLQTSVVRTNCMDCLDRTNVVQSVLAHWVLQKMFETSHVAIENQPWELDSNLLTIFQNLWADNADAVSISYSGTGALKTDFTRTGKRTYMGAFNDLVNSISRYYQNNLTDGPRQDSYDLFLGGFQPYLGHMSSPFADRRPIVIQFLPTILVASLTVFGATIFFPKNHFTSSKNLLFFLISSLILAVSSTLIVNNGLQFVNWPKLVDLGFLIVEHTHNEEKQFKGLKYLQNPKYIKPNKSTNNKRLD
ncbi:hypothetical protein KAFR_0E00190 [Kazachstania africana CBS 2517]|uniref:SAC domain-containing protein n=1 Tax=Kazachstania africana (strain ATCC 22294 / BCRC 22015 / CBS 2517 / CECT 1963 / NBRC 1671 / NRRL Y-8276) TaxID=1071382 RepID=H2AUX3_KAZAF|nr:hypothetical protein KAFR_0E00190 [Kazachstania africana CBS 2517]CCF58173.1 hypothetical protein KAFR_0E00190 [Kazachstania africana CBS 2517]